MRYGRRSNRVLLAAAAKEYERHELSWRAPVDDAQAAPSIVEGRSGAGWPARPRRDAHSPAKAGHYVPTKHDDLPAIRAVETALMVYAAIAGGRIGLLLAAAAKEYERNQLSRRAPFDKLRALRASSRGGAAPDGRHARDATGCAQSG
jgi:hypothetical protein